MSEAMLPLRRSAPALLIVILAIAALLPAIGGLQLGAGGAVPAERWNATLETLPPEPLVLVAYDPDVGTYAEIRPTVRAAVADLLARDARLAFVSLTPEGRALLAVELARLAREVVNPARLLDLGFVPGAEAAIVALAAAPSVPSAAEGSIARALATQGTSAIEALLVVGGNDLGPRSWVEQYLPRVNAPMPVLAITPTVLLPELQPYLDSGQVDAALATPMAGAAFRGAVDLGPLERLREVDGPSSLALLVGLLAAIAVLGQAWGMRVARVVRGAAREQERT